jgi:tetratricopeptide (TPR) repeat protein
MKWAILFMAHIYHRFNAELLSIIFLEPELRAVVPPLTFKELLIKLPRLSFVRRSSLGDDFVLHDEMRRLVIMHCWEKQDADKRLRRQLSRLAITYYEACLRQETDEQMRQSYLVEMLFHIFFINVDMGFSFFKEQFDRAIQLSLRAFASSLIREALKFVEPMSPDQVCRIQLSKAKLLQEEENPAAALQLYQEIEREGISTKYTQAEILLEKGLCYQYLSKFSESIACLKEALTIEEWQEDPLHYPTILGELAYIYYLKGDFTEAANYYKAAIELLQGLNDPLLYAQNLDNFAILRRFQGNLEEALRLSQQTLQIRRDLFKQGKGSKLFISWSLGVLGLVYFDQKNLIEAEKCFRENLDLGNDIGDKREIARAYIGLGLILTEQGDLEKALEYLEQAYHVTVHSQEKIESLQGQGSIFVLKKQWEEAAKYFEQAAKMAQEVGKTYHEAQSLIELAMALSQQGRSVTQLLEKAEGICRKQQYTLLLNRLGEVRAKIYINGNS